MPTTKCTLVGRKCFIILLEWQEGRGRRWGGHHPGGSARQLEPSASVPWGSDRALHPRQKSGFGVWAEPWAKGFNPWREQEQPRCVDAWSGQRLDSGDVVSASLGQMVWFIHNSFSFCVKPADVDTLWLHKTRCKRVIICKALQVLWVKGNVVIAKQCY